MSDLTRQHTPNATALNLAALALMAIGIVMVFSTSVSLDGPLLSDPAWRTPGVRQAIYVFLAVTVLVAVSWMPYQWWRLGRSDQRSLSTAIAAVAVVCLTLTLIPGIGIERNGARRWLGAFGLSFQPSELAKLATIVFLAAYLTSGRPIHRFWRGLMPACAVVGLTVLLVGLEDFGTAALLAALAAAMLAVGGARIRHLLLLAVPAAVGMAAMIVFWPYRLERLTSFVNIWADPSGKGYHAIQSLVSFASGGLTGRGLGNGIQKHGYLPEAQSDFIFSVIGEELGLLGVVAVIGLFAVILWQGRKIMLAATDPLGRLLAFGVTWLFGLQAIMNIAVVTVSVPTKGIALPLVSAGGSGLVLLGAAIGILLNVARQAREPACPVAR